jgi:hypothetical protein
VFGDARPPLPEDTSQYPTMIVSSVFSLAQSLGAQLMIGTGDYMNALSTGAVSAQLQLLHQAEAMFTGPVYHALGNHECMISVGINCPKGNESAPITAFMSQLVPSGTSTPYYRVDVGTPRGKAKFLMIAGNAWTDAQNAWLKAQLADPTPYTFCIRHVPTGTMAPGVTESDALLASAPVTATFYGHVHEYNRIDSSHVIVGNGGAPLYTSGGYYGMLLVEQHADGNVSLTEHDVATGMPTDTWKITPTGQAAP